MIIQYKNNVFTHKGQCAVNEFGQEILGKSEALKKVQNLTVYVGYHGNSNGDWDHDFDVDEKKETKKIGEQFPNATLTWITNPGLAKEEIEEAVKIGKVFFTWCDSDKRVNDVMGGEMPSEV